MQLTVRQIMETHIADVRKNGERDETIQAKYYSRPVAYKVAWVFIKVGIRPEIIALSALAVDATGCILVGLGDYLLGAILLNIGHLLDYTDGTMARATNTVTAFGGYLDRTSDEIVETMIPVSIGVGLYVGSCSFGGLPPLFYLLLGLVYAILHLLSTVSVLHTRMYYKETLRELSVRSGLKRWLYTGGVNLKTTAVPALLIISFVPNGLPVFLIVFAVLTVCELVVGVYSVVRNR